MPNKKHKSHLLLTIFSQKWKLGLQKAEWLTLDHIPVIDRSLKPGFFISSLMLLVVVVFH